jgi:uncharacterized membrane protein YgaE (UPF0421/DUF939 family)
MPTAFVDFSFLSEDVRRQREIAEQALEEAKRVDALLKDTTDPKLKGELEKTRETLLNVARGLAVNATSTSSAATIKLWGACEK